MRAESRDSGGNICVGYDPRIVQCELMMVWRAISPFFVKTDDNDSLEMDEASYNLEKRATHREESKSQVLTLELRNGGGMIWHTGGATEVLRVFSGIRDEI